MAVTSDYVFATSRDVSAFANSGSADQVRVVVRDDTGALADTWFNLAVIC